MAETDRSARWETPEGQQLARQVFGRLSANKSLTGLRLGEYHGRIDLRGIPAPTPERVAAYQKQGWVVQELGGLVEFKGAKLASMDFTGARLESLRMFHTTITNCRFDEARCPDWRLWAVEVTDTSFVGADLRQSVLGAWFEGRGDVYHHVDFSGPNLRSIVCPAATFVDCDFGDARLAKIDFQSSSFIRCRFSGLLREVTFYDYGFRTGKPDPNPMEDVDFSEAELRMVEFRGLDLDRVRFPQSQDHLVVRGYRCVLERGLDELQGDKRWAGLRVILDHRLKWAGPHQGMGVFNRRDLVDMGGEDEAAFAERLLRRLGSECAGE